MKKLEMLSNSLKNTLNDSVEERALIKCARVLEERNRSLTERLNNAKANEESSKIKQKIICNERSKHKSVL